MAVEAKARYIEIHVHSPLEIALQRNSKRQEGKVPEEVIKRMNTKLEPCLYQSEYCTCFDSCSQDLS